MFEKYMLDNRAIDYIKDELSKGRELAHHLSAGIDWATGITFAFLPPQQDQTALYQFTAGGKAINVGLQSKIRRFIYTYLHTHQDGIFVAEETDYEISESYYAGYSTNTIFEYRNTPYNYLLSSDKFDEEHIKSTMFAGTYPSISILANLRNSRKHVQHHQQISVQTLDQLVKNTDYVLIGVYDDEAKLIWERQK